MRRREVISTIGATFGLPATALAQQAGRTYRVGLVSPQPSDHLVFKALLEGLSGLGFVEGKNLQIDRQGTGLRAEQFAPHAKELVEAKVDAIIAATDAAFLAVRQATTTIPILTVADDMVGEGRVQSMARPGGNVTGISLLATELDGKRQELLIELLPGVRRLAALADAQSTAPHALQALQDAAHVSGVDLDIRKVKAPTEIASAIDAAKAAGAAGLNVLASSAFFTHHRIILERTAAIRLPAIYQWPDYVLEGGLAGYGPNLGQIFRDQIAALVAAVLRGARPADQPVQQPTTFQFAINLGTAKALGIIIPTSILARTNEVIE